MTDEPPIILDEDSAIDSAFFGSHAGRTCYARAHRSGWVLVVRQAVAQRELPVMIRVWGRVDRMPDDGCQLPGTVGALRQSALTPHGKAVRLFASLCSHHCSARPRKALPIWRGTDGSNPSPSSKESAKPRSLSGNRRLSFSCDAAETPVVCSDVGQRRRLQVPSRQFDQIVAAAGPQRGEASFPSIAQMKAHGYWGVPKIHALFEDTYFVGLRKAGVPEE